MSEASTPYTLHPTPPARETAPAGKFDWLKGIEIADLLTGDLQLIHEWCGRDVLLALWEHCGSMTLYISQKPLVEAKKRFIRKHVETLGVKRLCSILVCSERFVYEVMADVGRTEGQEGLFDE
jgi:hypothetical protein